jgi:YVTN family beta-propeller protein
MHDEFRSNYYSDLESRKGSLFLAILLQIMILLSTLLLSHNNSFAQTYDAITKQREIFKNNPQITLGRGVGYAASELLAVNPSTNEIYVANSGSNTISVIDSDSGNITTIPVGISPAEIAVSPSTNKIYVANLLSNTVSVINGFNDKQIGEIQDQYLYLLLGPGKIIKRIQVLIILKKFM